MAKKISPDKIKKAIIEEAQKIKRKREIFNEVKQLNGELQNLNESFGVVGTFGFDVDGDKSKETKTGFSGSEEVDRNVSQIERLAREMGLGQKERENLNESEEIKNLKEENKKLKKEIKELKNNQKK